MDTLSLGSGMEHYIQLQVVEEKQNNQELVSIIILSETRKNSKQNNLKWALLFTLSTLL